MVDLQWKNKKIMDFSEIILNLVSNFKCMTVDEIKMFFSKNNRKSIETYLYNLVNSKKLFYKTIDNEIYFYVINETNNLVGYKKAFTFLKWLFAQTDIDGNNFRDLCDWISVSSSSSLLLISIDKKIYEVFYVNSEDTEYQVDLINIYDRMYNATENKNNINKFVVLDDDVNMDYVDIQNVTNYILIDKNYRIKKII